MLEYIGSAVALTRAVKPGIAVSRSALRKLRLAGTFDVRWIELGDKPGLTAPELSELEEFLGQRDTRGLLSVLAMTLLTPPSQVRDNSLDTARTLFMNLVQQRHASGECHWFDRRNEIWDALVQIYDRATPAGAALADAAVEFEDFMRSPIGRGQMTESGRPVYQRYIERLSELCSDLNRVGAALSTAERLRTSIAAAPTPPIITYTSTSKPATFGDLYVSRTLVDKSTGAEVDGLRLGDRAAPYRAVLHGAPGAGKSTYVRNLRRELAEDVDGQAAILLTARTYFPSAQHQSIVEFLHGDMHAAFGLDISESDLRDMLILGLSVVIFDGLDEITDINQRIEMVQRISSFASEYPATSILVTSRSIGYERAPLPNKLFGTVVLDEYSKEQTEEYIGKWFTYIERPELVSAFTGESESVSDLKRNPLLLSLICILYRERGSIPRRRRDIYAQCADLLFHTWDSHRHINQPEELHANGDRIMQELARWVYNSPAAQNGLSESIITKQIGIYLRDSVGVEEGEARRRAGEFLEFCAERAWLLGTTGSDYGERLFGFTHRTFFEYFTAEAISRTSADPAKIAVVLVDAHKRDATSVLPELLLQATDERLDRGAAATFQLVCQQTQDAELILQLMEGVPLPARTRTVGFDRVLELWRHKGSISGDAFRALLSLHLDARSQFDREYLKPDQPLAADLFLGAWASLDLADQASDFEAVWGDTVAFLAKEHAPLRETWYEGSVAAWRWRRGAAPLTEPGREILVTQGAFGPCIGSLWLGLEQVTAKEWRTREDLSALFSSATKRARGRTVLSEKAARAFVEGVSHRLTPTLSPKPEKLHGDALWAYLYATGIIYEVTWYDSEARETFRTILPSIATDLWARRVLSADEDRVDSRQLPSPVPNGPRWLQEWGAGKRAFTAFS